MYQFLSERIKFDWGKNHKFPNLAKINVRGLINYQTKPFMTLRKNSLKMSSNKVDEMITKYDFCDQSRNQKGKGIPHLYLKSDEEKVIVDYTPA